MIKVQRFVVRGAIWVVALNVVDGVVTDSVVAHASYEEVAAWEAAGQLRRDLVADLDVAVTSRVTAVPM